MTRRGTMWTMLVALLLGGALMTLVVAVRAGRGPVAAASPAEAPRALGRIEREALERFAKSEPRVRLPSGETIAPSNEAHALDIKVNLYKGILAREEEARDPTFRLKAEAELEKRRPMHASVSWEDLSGNREMVFVIEDSSGCALGEQTALSLVAKDVGRHPCLDRGEGLWEADGALTVSLEPVGKGEPLWNELLRDTMKQLAAEAYLARGGDLEEGAGEAEGEATR